MRFDIVPTVSVNNIPFGASREEVRNALGEYEEFKKDEDDKVTTDDFDFCHVFYDDENRFEAIEIFEENTVYINGRLVYPAKPSELCKLADDFEEDYGTNISLSLSMGTDAPDEDEDEEDEEIAESVVFAKKGYYDEFLSD